jgi:hypothetical protein
MRRQDVLRCVLVAALASLTATGCGEEQPSFEGAPCARMEGVWDAHVDMNGLDASQRWTISQDGCRVTMIPDPPYCYGVFLCESAKGDALESGVRATWIYYTGPCRYTSLLEATVSGGTMEGTVTWFASPYGNGYCSSHQGVSSMTATRL